MDFSATTGPISTKLGVYIDTLCQSPNVKKKDDRGKQRRVTVSKPEVPFSRQPLGRFQSEFPGGWIHYVQVFIQKIKTIEARSTELQSLASHKAA